MIDIIAGIRDNIDFRVLTNGDKRDDLAIEVLQHGVSDRLGPTDRVWINTRRGRRIFHRGIFTNTGVIFNRRVVSNAGVFLAGIIFDRGVANARIFH